MSRAALASLLAGLPNAQFARDHHTLSRRGLDFREAPIPAGIGARERGARWGSLLNHHAIEHSVERP